MDEALLRALLATFGRSAFSPEDLLKILAPKSGGDKQIEAYNLCNGRTSQSDIAKKTGLDAGNFSRTISRWVDEGVMFRVEPDQHPLHLYPLSKLAVKRIAKVKENSNE